MRVSYGEALVRVEHLFAGGEVIRIDNANENVTINSVDARAYVALSSDFFPLSPGNVTLVFSGCTTHVTAFHERWL